METGGVYMPWALGFEDGPSEEKNSVRFVEITLVIYGRDTRSKTLSVPADTDCMDLKGHLAVNGVVSTCSGLEVALEEGGKGLADSAKLKLCEGQTLHLTRGIEMVSVTALVSGGGRSDDEVYELVVPSEATGASLREHISQCTSGALVAAAVFVARDENAAHSVGDEEFVSLVDEQAIYVQRAVTAPSTVAPNQSAETQSHPAPGFINSMFSLLRGRRNLKDSKGSGAASGFHVCSASNIKVMGGKVACTSKLPWAACAVFDVPDRKFFEICVQLLADAPTAEANGLAGRWMLGVVPTVFAATKTESDRRSLLHGGFFVTVCHGHPAKVRVPSMPRGTCGEDFAAVPGELRAGQTLTLRWTAGGSSQESGVLSVQVGDMDPVALPYAPPPFEEVLPCLVFGGKPVEVRVMQLEAAARVNVGGA